ncbi:MAG: gltX [Paenibacillaceae bacterium]|nr:gltX [Paenibacillaceae bacterium]
MRVRYAPSPTGHLHIGGARTALFDYLTARKTGGQFVVRFEDTDQTRHKESGIQDQLDGLRWLGLEWDESVDVGGPYAPYRQTERLSLYKPYTEQLLAGGHAYHCYCSEEDLEQERAEQEARGEMMAGYSGRCRHLTPEQTAAYIAEGRKPSVRFRVPAGRVISFVDQVREQVEFESDGIGDFIIVRPDGMPTYNYAVVLDDVMMKISLVIRGEEHLSNTPRQILLYEALGLPVPEFAHLALILNEDRKKMSKRDETVLQFMNQYSELGYIPEALLNFIVLLGWSPVGEQEIFTKEELIEQFDLSRVSKSPAVFDAAKLNYLANQYMKKAGLARVVSLCAPHLEKAGLVAAERTPDEQAWVEKLVALYQEQLTCGAEIVPLSAMFFEPHVQMENEEAAAVLKEESVPVVLSAFLGKIKETEDLSPENVGVLLKQVQKETGFKGKSLFMPVRVALTGQMHGRDLNHTIHLLGREKVAARLQGVLS